jgi:alpha-ketoglutarate-dependent taurine dioxygenase
MNRDIVPIEQAVDRLATEGWVCCDAGGVLTDADALAWASRFGVPASYAGQTLVVDVRPRPGGAGASYAGTAEFDLHTDCAWHENPPRILVMFCLQIDQGGGGIPRLADGWAAFRTLTRAQQEMLRSTPLNFTPPSHVALPGVCSPVVSGEAGDIRLRFRADVVPAGLPGWAQTFRSAVTTLSFEVPVRPGTAYIVNNHRMLHGRTALTSGQDSRRHFKRVYVN